jgi:hypothetical protein
VVASAESLPGSSVQASRDLLRKGKYSAMKIPAAPTTQAAETLAIQALAFLAEEPDRLSDFLSVTGIAGDQIRAAADEPDFLAGVLEHMLGDENLLIAFAQSAGIDPAEIGRAYSVLRRPSEVP